MSVLLDADASTRAPPAHAARELAIGFVTYRPDAGFYERVAQVCKAGHDVFVFDNAPEATDHARLAADDPRLHYSTGGKNLGLGVGLSVVCGSAHARGCRFLLFFDQDTRFTPATLEYADDVIRRQLPAISRSHVAVVLQAPRGDGRDGRPVDRMLAISSGMLFLLENVAAIGWHNTRYFVDGVDYEFCLRARAHGLRVAELSGAPGFDHVTDQADQDRTLFGRPMRVRKYPWWRVLDSLGAYLKLAGRSLLRFDLRALWAVLRSLAIFIVGQCLAHLLIRGSR